MRWSYRFGALTVSTIALTPPAAGAPSSYWCEPARAYYPQVATCPVPWRAVNPAQAVHGTPPPPAWVPYATQYAPYDNYNHGNGP